MTTDTYVCAGWACTDCTILLANGEVPPDSSEAETDAWLADIEQRTAGYRLTLGLGREDHDCRSNFTVRWRARHEVPGSLRAGTLEVLADDYADAMDMAYWKIPAGAWLTVARAHELETESDRGGECDCETQTYSTSSCDVCGCWLHGERHAVAFWAITPAA